MEKYESSTSSLFSYKGKEIEAQFQLGQSDVNIHQTCSDHVCPSGGFCKMSYGVLSD